MKRTYNTRQTFTYHKQTIMKQQKYLLLTFLILLIVLLFCSCKSTENIVYDLEDAYETLPPSATSDRIDVITDDDKSEQQEINNITNVIHNTPDDIYIDNTNNIIEDNYLYSNNIIDNKTQDYQSTYTANDNTIPNNNVLEEQYIKSMTQPESKRDFYNSIVQYIYLDGKIYSIVTKTGYITDIRLENNEEINGAIAIGDSSYWSIETASSVENGDDIVHILVRPETSDSSTTMIVPTNMRTYYFYLTTTDGYPMVAIRFKYPNNRKLIINNNQKASHNSSKFSNNTAIKDRDYTIDASHISFNYEIEEDAPYWAPNTVFSDGKTTFFQFDPRFVDTPGAPALYLNTNGELSLINYSIKGNLYMTKTIISGNSSFVFIKGDERVEITRSTL